MRKWIKGAHVSGVREGSPAAVRRREWLKLVEMFCPICVYWPIRVWDVPHAYTHMGCPYAYGTTFSCFISL